MFYVVLDGEVYSSHESWTEAQAMAVRLERETARQSVVQIMSEATAMSYGLID